MKKIITLLIIFLLIACSVEIEIGNSKHREEEWNCSDECSIYNYDANFKEMIGDSYEHPWCICMAECEDDENFCEETFSKAKEDEN